VDPRDVVITAIERFVTSSVELDGYATVAGMPAAERASLVAGLAASLGVDPEDVELLGADEGRRRRLLAAVKFRVKVPAAASGDVSDTAGASAIEDQLRGGAFKNQLAAELKIPASSIGEVVEPVQTQTIEFDVVVADEQAVGDLVGVLSKDGGAVDTLASYLPGVDASSIQGGSASTRVQAAATACAAAAVPHSDRDGSPCSGVVGDACRFECHPGYATAAGGHTGTRACTGTGEFSAEGCEPEPCAPAVRARPGRISALSVP
jgi:hypothetical protein